MFGGFLKKIFGDPNERTIARLQKTVLDINALEPAYRELTDAALKARTGAFRERLVSGEALDDILPDAFAAVREASRRTIGLRHYDVQLIGGMILHQGEVAEMRTGEGKTLVATLPLYLNALTGAGAHLVTPNDYLAKVGVQWMGPVYHALGVSVSVIQSGAGRPDEASFLYDPAYASDDDRYQHLRPITRREAYRANITYGTNNEFGFDYLRDNMVVDLDQCTQRDLVYAIVDEVDSILIDEARTPLIISGPAEESSDLYRRFAQLVPQLRAETDYEVDPRSQIVILTEEGVAKVESMVNIPEGESIYDPEHAAMLPYLDNALRAKEFFTLDKEYVVRDGEIIIVDSFTGRLMFGRRYSEGLHQAIEAKEGVTVRRESLTYATITFQNFFRMYDKLAGMTGTAATEKEELRKIYDLDVVVLPTNVEYRAQYGNLEEQQVRPPEAGVAFSGVLDEQDNYPVTVYDGPDGVRFYQRLDMPDQIYKTEAGKFEAVINEIQATHEAQRPVLVGTTAIETSERLSRLLKRRRVPHEVLNAKYHEKEALIIAQAGRPGSVTIATNMAGRGVDILLGGNPEGLARDKLRREGVELAAIPSLGWEQALKMARAGEDPTTVYDERWAEVLRDEILTCRQDRDLIYSQGGLHVIGTERHEARRIDNQLRGRAGRQGDPGSSRFFISLEDELMRRFGGERLQPWMDRAGLEEEALESNMLGRVIESVQERVEGYNFDVRKHVLEYDNVVNKQREVIYAERRKVLSRSDLHDDLMEMFEAEVRQVVSAHATGDGSAGDGAAGEQEAMLAELRRFAPIPRNIDADAFLELEDEALIAQCAKWADDVYTQMNERIGLDMYRAVRQQELSVKTLFDTSDPFYSKVGEWLTERVGAEIFEPWYDYPLRRLPAELEAEVRQAMVTLSRLFRDRRLILKQIDDHWVQHLTSLDMLREGIGLRAVGQQNPLVAYQKESFEMYQEMMASIQSQIVRTLFLVPQSAVAGRSRAAAAPVPAESPRQRQLSFQAGGSQSSDAAPQPARAANKPGRNDPCWCGSGKKYKDCHWRSDRRAASTADR
ncbi:MAG: SEC-C domain-containing protein [Anaerolineae bacterium]|nr:SEC-C domain-containing protein [Anaerolineae bacterium]